jgi:hypothetical protein
MYCTSNRTYVKAHKWIWEPIILGFQMGNHTRLFVLTGMKGEIAG